MPQLADQFAASLDHPDRWIPRLTRMLDRQHELYAELDTLSQTQSAHIESGDTQAVLSVLAARQPIIDQIAALNTDLDPFVRSWTRLVAAVSPTHRNDLEQRFAAIDAIIAGISRRDETDRVRLESLRRAASEGMHSASRARAAAAAYGGESASRDRAIPRYQDREA